MRFDLGTEVLESAFASEHGFSSPPLPLPESARWLLSVASIYLFLSPVVCARRPSAHRTAPSGCWRKLPTSRKSSLALPDAEVLDRARRVPRAALFPMYPGWPVRSLGHVAIQKSACAGSAGPTCPAAIPVVLLHL